MDNSNQPISQENPESIYSPDEVEQDYAEAYVSEGGVPLPSIPVVEWSASEYIAHEKSAGWYLALFAGGGMAAVVVYVISRDILSSIVILLACAAISVYAGRKPSTNRYILSENGVQVEQKFYPYGGFRSFSVVEEGAINSIWLKPLKRFAPIVTMYFSPDDEQKIIDVLANFLPHEERELDAIDRFSKRIRF